MSTMQIDNNLSTIARRLGLSVAFEDGLRDVVQLVARAANGHAVISIAAMPGVGAALIARPNGAADDDEHVIHRDPGLTAEDAPTRAQEIMLRALARRPTPQPWSIDFIVALTSTPFVYELVREDTATQVSVTARAAGDHTHVASAEIGPDGVEAARRTCEDTLIAIFVDEAVAWRARACEGGET